MAETGNPIIDLMTFVDLQTRIAALESALGKLNSTSVPTALSEVNSIPFITYVNNAGNATSGDLSHAKFLVRTVNCTGINGTWKLVSKVDTSKFASADKILTVVTMAGAVTDNNKNIIFTTEVASNKASVNIYAKTTAAVDNVKDCYINVLVTAFYS